MARLGYVINADFSIALYEIGAEDANHVLLRYESMVTKRAFHFLEVGTEINSFGSVVSASRILSALAALGMSNADMADPLKVLAEIDAAHGKQCVWLPDVGLRSVAKIKEDQQWWVAKHLPEFRVQAKEESTAKIRLAKQITDMMTKKPARAIELASWFGAGQVVEKHDEQPGFISRSIFDLKSAK
jgi:hypothetical protein